MGRDLCLIPVDTTGPDPSFGHSLLELVRNELLFEEIDELEERYGQPVPNGFTSFRGRVSFGVTGYGETRMTPYGIPLQMVPAPKLVRLGSYRWQVSQNLAAYQYLRYSKHKQVALFWH